MLSNIALVLLASFLGAQAQVITGLTKCPTTERSYTADDGSIYAICPDTNYEGDSKTEIYDVASSDACAALCNKEVTCKQAVYQANIKGCYLRTGNLKWVPDTKFASLRFVTRPAQGSIVTTCPTTETMVTLYGVTLAICANTEYSGQNKAAVPGIKSVNDCAALCARTADCKNSVYNKADSLCYIKAIGTPSWTYNVKSSSARVTKIPNNGSPQTSCPGPGQTPITAKSGGKFLYCVNGDWQSQSLDTRGAVASAQACVDICGARSGCTKASYDVAGRTCQTKGESVFVFNQGMVSIQAAARRRFARALYLD